MDYFNDVLLPFWALNVSVALLSMQGQKALRFHQKYLNLCSEDEQRSYRFGTTWRWVINDRIFIFVWTNPLKGKTVHPEMQIITVYSLMLLQTCMTFSLQWDIKEHILENISVPVSTSTIMPTSLLYSRVSRGHKSHDKAKGCNMSKIHTYYMHLFLIKCSTYLACDFEHTLGFCWCCLDPIDFSYMN